MRHSSLFCVFVLSTLGPSAVAQTTVPHIFTPGTPARAVEVNENFQALATAIDSLAARLTKLEGGPIVDADVIGSYTISILQLGIGEVASGIGDTDAITYDGTFTFAADHTFTSTFSGHKNTSSGPQPDDGTISGTWNATDNDVTITITDPVDDGSVIRLHCAVGCRVIVGAHFGSSSGPGDEGLNNLMILARVE